METAFEHEPLNAVFCGFVSISRGHRGSFRPTRAGQSDLLDFQTLENADLRKMDLHVEHPTKIHNRFPQNGSEGAQNVLKGCRRALEIDFGVYFRDRAP